jgi:hypothetical protein
MNEITQKMINEMNNFDRHTVVSLNEMLCDEIGAYVHTVATMRFNALQCKHFARYTRYNEIHKNAVATMTLMYFNNIDETIEYVINNY